LYKNSFRSGVALGEESLIQSATVSTAYPLQPYDGAYLDLNFIAEDLFVGLVL